jgi:nucleoside-diphosphate-sugar epimerase
MKVLVVGCGLVGRALAGALRADGHTVVGTTTSPTKVDELRQICDDVAVLRGADAVAVADAAIGADAVVVCAGPDARRAMSAEERAATYEDVLVRTAEGVSAGVVAAGVTGPVVALSSLSVYGAADGLQEVDEDSPLTASEDPSPRCFRTMESIYRDRLAGQAVVLRCADIFGPSDPPIDDKVRFAHSVLGGSVPFSGDALFYRVHVDDVVAAIRHALSRALVGTFNLTHAGTPPTNREAFDAIGARLDLPPLVFRGEIVAPAVPVSTARLRATGFACTRTEVHNTS